MPGVFGTTPIARTGLPPAPKPAPPRKAAPLPTSTRAGNNPRGVAIVQPRAPLPPPPTSTRTGSNPRGVAITPTTAPTVNDRAATQRNPERTPAMHALAVAIAQRIQALWRGPDQPFLAPFDPIARNVSQAIPRLQVQSQFNQDFANLRSYGLLPAGAKQPPLEFPATGGGVQHDLPYEANGRIYLTPGIVQAATSLNSPLHAHALEIPIHELAHALQRPSVLANRSLREGGAQAYADAAVPAVVGPIPTNDTNYTGYVNQVRKRQAPWFMRNQFR